MDHLLEMFQCPKNPQTRKMAEAVLKKDARVYYFGGDGKTREISNLNPGAQDLEEAGWGGLTEFSGRVANILAAAVAESD